MAFRGVSFAVMAGLIAAGLTFAPAALAECEHPTAMFTWRGKPLRSVNNTAWLNARARAVAKYQERFGEPAPEGFRTMRMHDLRHTVGRRLRAAGVGLETRQAILGHKSGSITTH